MSECLSRTVADHVCRVRLADLPQAAVRAAKWSLLDQLGVALAASTLGEGCDAFASLALAAGAGTAPLLGRRACVSAPLAALANGALAHALDFEDAYDDAPVHPNAAAVPALLALAAVRPGISGADLVVALATGTDIACRLALALEVSPEEWGWYPPPLFSAQGAATACGKLLALDAPQLLNAWSLTLCLATCSGEFKRTADSTLRAVREGFSAQAGLEAALLAAAGARGFAAPYEGAAGLFALYAHGKYRSARVLEDLGTVFEGANVSYKLYPSCRGTHTFIDAALRLRADGIAAGQIKRAELTGHPLMRMLSEPAERKRAPITAIDAKFSAHYCFAHALVHGAVGLDSFDAESLREPVVLELARRVEFLPDATAAVHAMSGGSTHVWLADGREWQCEIPQPRGSAASPITEPELIAKFLDCARRARVPLPELSLGRLVETVLQLERVADVESGLIAPLRGPP